MIVTFYSEGVSFALLGFSIRECDMKPIMAVRTAGKDEVVVTYEHTVDGARAIANVAMTVAEAASIEIDTPQIPVETMRSRALDAVSQAVNDVRKHFVSDLPGQDMVYLRKEAEARAWVASPQPDIADYPFLTAEVGITAPDPYQLAQVWLNMAASWIGIASVIENARFSANVAITTAKTTEQIAGIVAQFNVTMSAVRSFA